MSEKYASKLRIKLESEESKAFRVRFKEQRNAKDLSQKAIAEELAVSIDTVRNWEQGFSMPGVDTLISICNYFGCSIDYILGKAEERTHDATTVREITGLSENAINQLISWKNDIDAMDSETNQDVIYEKLESFSAYQTLQQILEYKPDILFRHIRYYVNLIYGVCNGMVANDEYMLTFDDISELTFLLLNKGDVFANGSVMAINEELLKSSLMRSIENYIEDLAENNSYDNFKVPSKYEILVKKRNTDT